MSRELIGCNSREFSLFVLVVFLCLWCATPKPVCSVYRARRVIECVPSFKILLLTVVSSYCVRVVLCLCSLDISVWVVVSAGHQCVSVSVVVGASSSTHWVEPHFQAALLPLGNGRTQEGPPSRQEPASREDSLGREPVEPGSNPPPPPPSPTVAPEPDSGSRARQWLQRTESPTLSLLASE